MQVVFVYLTCLLTSGIISLSQATKLKCGGSAKYKLTFKGEWTKQSHPQDFPEGKRPHFSPIVGCSHNASYVMWRVGENATKGVQNVAEFGSTGEINKEINEQISQKRAINKFQGSGISNVGTRIVNVEVNTDYPLVSAVSMIAPSPDWFVGVRDYTLCNTTTGKWINKRVRQLPLYDSGTDSGKTFVHTGTVTNPPVPIFLIKEIPEDSGKNETLLPFGTFTFEKISESPSPTSSVSPTNQATSSTTSEASLVQHLGSTSVQATVPGKMSRSTEGNLKLTVSASATTTMMPSSITTPSEASSVQHLGVFLFLTLIILNLFFY